MSRAKGCRRPLALTGDIFHEAVVAGTGQDVRACGSMYDVARHEHRRRSACEPMYRITGHYPIVSPSGLGPEIGQQLAHGSQERWLVDGDVGAGRSDDEIGPARPRTTRADHAEP